MHEPPVYTSGRATGKRPLGATALINLPNRRSIHVSSISDISDLAAPDATGGKSPRPSLLQEAKSHAGVARRAH